MEFSEIIQFLAILEERNWEDARQYCINLGRRLVEVRTQEDYDQALTLRLEFDEAYYLGGTDILDNDAWVWDSNGESINTTHFWAENQPSSSAENCIMMAYGGFHDLPCLQLRPFVCELI